MPNSTGRTPPFPEPGNAMLNISLQHRMMMKLSPQQVQYLKMLQLPTLALEQKIKAELEMNPLLEEGYEEELEAQTEQDERPEKEEPVEETPPEKVEESHAEEDEKYSIEDYMNDDLHGYKAREPFDSEEKEELPIADSVSLSHRLLEQFSLLDLDDDEILIGQEIIGNVDEDGYLRRDLNTIVQDVNLTNSTAITVEKAEQVLQEDPAHGSGRDRLPFAPGMPARPARGRSASIPR